MALLAELAPDDLGRAAGHRRTARWLAGLLLALLISIPLATALGPVAVPPDEVLRVLGHHMFGVPGQQAWSAAADSIVWQVRLPRVLLGAAVGAALAVAGGVMQAAVRNVLAEPYLMGISAGASVGAVLSILFGVGAALGIAATSVGAFTGALAATAAVFAIASVGGHLTSLRLLLAGVAVGYVLSAVTSFLVFASDAREAARTVLFWLLGSLSQARWSGAWVVWLALLAGLAVLVLWGRRLDALALGDETARTLGVTPRRLRAQVLTVSALMVGAAVAMAGSIGFVGLVVPHVARVAVGASHRRMLPVAALIGAVFLVWADVAARVAFAPRELPIGILTAIAGAPLLLLLIRRLGGPA